MDGFVKYVGPSVDFGEAPAVDMFSRTWEKRAGMSIYMPPAIEEFMKTAEPVPGKRLLLVHGMGSEEAWGFNRNGDGFPEMWKGAKNLIEDDPGTDYGYHTFAKHAHTFRDHRNHDPRLTIGGKVVLAAWNPEMRRVELIIPVSEKHAPDVVDAIDHDEKIAVSMGCKVPYDVCSDCGNQAKHRGEYCKHAKHEMNRIRANGVKVGVHNPRPKFFDISVLGDRGTGRPADPSAFSLAKVASEQNAMAEWPDRPKLVKVGYIRQGARKNADIKKEIPAEAEEATKDRLEKIKVLAPYNAKEAKALPRTAIASMKGQADPEKVAATLTALGITLRPDEFEEVFPQGAPQIDFGKVAMNLVENYEAHMPARSDWLSYFGDRMYRHIKVGSDAAPLGKGSLEYKKYLENVKNAVSKPSMIKELVAAVDRHPYLKSAIARHDLAKLAAGAKGLSAGNLIAAMLGPMVLSSYFRSQQMQDPWSVGPVKSLVADHPLATGAATALLWHKLKGGTVPLIGS